jgi:cell division protein FtsA
MDDKLVVAVDFGNSKIAVAAAFKKENGDLKLVDFRQIKSNKNLILNGKIADTSALANEVVELIKKIETDNNVKIGKIHFAVSPHTLRSEIRKVSVDSGGSQLEDAEMLANKAENVQIAENRCVFSVVQLETGFGVKAEGNFLINSMQVAVKEKINSLNNSVLSVYKLQKFITPLVEAEQFLNINQKKNGIIVIDFGAGCTSFAVYQNGFPRICAAVPFGSEHITKDIAQKFDIGEVVAEQLKIQKAVASKKFISRNIKFTINNNYQIDSEELAEVVSSRLNEIFNLIFEELKSQNIEHIEEILLMGGGSKLGFLPDFLTALSKMKVNTIDFKIATDKKNSNFSTAENSLLYALLKNCNENCRAVEHKKVKQETPVKKQKWSNWQGVLNLFESETEIVNNKKNH